MLKNEDRKGIVTAKLDLEVDKTLVEALKTMESFTKISQVVLLETALKRFIATHKDYFPADSKS